MTTEHDEGSAEGRAEEGYPADGVKALAGKENSSDTEKDGHGTHHERGVAHGGVGKSVELNEELDGDAEGGGDKQDADLGGGEADPVEQCNRKHANGSEEEAVEHHVLHTHFVQGKTAEVEAGAPEAACNRACAIPEKGSARAERGVRRHLSF
jgi:hypothetical protein